jgi:hypothetical protein
MAYTIDLSLAIDDTRETATISDETVFGTGGNPARSAVRVFLTGYKIDFEDEIAETYTMVSNTGSATTVSAWEYTYTIDGWAKFLYVIIKDAYDSGTSYDIYDAVYDGSNNVYRSKQNANIGNALGNTTYWELITDPSSLAENVGEANESLNIESTIYQRILTFDSQYGYGNFLAEDGSACCGDCDEPGTVQTYKKLSLLVNAAVECDIRSLLPEGEKICRKLQSLLDC